MSIRPYRWYVAVLAAVSLFAGAASATDPFASIPLDDTARSLPVPASAPLAPLLCDWRVANGTPEDDSDRVGIRFGFIDLGAGYWQAILSPKLPVGTRFRIEGRYPAARNFSFQLYDGGKLSLDELRDDGLVPDPGSRSPFTGVNTVDTRVEPGGRYTGYLIYGPRPAVPAPNTLYVDASRFTGALDQAVLVYRVYNAFAGITLAAHGGVPLPSIYRETPQGDVPLAELDTTVRCNAGIGARNTERRSFAFASDVYNAQPKRPGPIPAQPVPAPPQFLLRDSGSDILANRDNRYLYAIHTQTDGDLVLMRAKAPTYATQPGVGSDPQVRHWSVCSNAKLSAETYRCVQDEDATLDPEGFFNIVFSVAAKRPPLAIPRYGFDWITQGTTTDGFPIFRQMLASPNFVQSAFQVPAGADPRVTMGDYFPVATYCAASVFEAHVRAGEPPRRVFEGCQAGR